MNPLYQYYYIPHSRQRFEILLNETGSIRRNSCTCITTMGGTVFVPPIWKTKWFKCGSFNAATATATKTKGNLRAMSTPTAHLAPSVLYPHDYHTAMVHASGLSYFYSSQPGSSQFPPDEEVVERAFWQGTPTVLEELRQGTDDECHQAGAFLSRLIIAYYVLTHHTVKLVSKDQDRPNDPLSLSTQQSRLICQTWASAACSVDHSSDGETQTPPRPKHRNRRGGAARPDSSSTISGSDKPTFFGHLNNIEKVCKTVDERMQKRKVEKEWSSKVVSETARLRDEDNPKENMNTKMHGERPPSNDNADIAQVDAFDDDSDLLGLGTAQPHDRDLESAMEEVPTSQPQERYLSLSHLSQISPTGSLGASYAPINGNHLAVPVTSEMLSVLYVPDAITVASKDPAAPTSLSGRRGKCLP